PGSAGSLVLEVTATGPGGSTIANSPSVTVSAPAPQTLNFTAAQVIPGWTFATNDGTAGRRLLRAYTDGALAVPSIWMGTITGTDATGDYRRSTGASLQGMIEVSIDGGAWTAATLIGGTGTTYQLFSGLSDTKHKVRIRPASSAGSTTYQNTSGDVMTVTGSAPAIEVYGNWVQPGDGNTNTMTGSALQAIGQSGFAPALRVTNDGTATINAPAITVRGEYTTLAIAAQARYVDVSVDGGPITIYDTGTVVGQGVVLTGLSGTHTYSVSASAAIAGRWLSVGGFLGSGGIQNIATKRYLLQVGDSITQGDIFDSNCGATDTYRVAAARGYAAGNLGVAGNTTAQLQARIDAALATMPSRGTNDIAIIAISRNDNTYNTDVGGNDGSFDQATIDNYTYIINALLAKGFGTVLCRGVLPETIGSYPLKSASIQSIVTNMANPKVKFVSMADMGTVNRPDGVHPDALGYSQLAAIVQPKYVAAGMA
uniref:SGNH/GDSL hydrolase family protein n=1 Tax=Sphingomonas sp. TaxID=28214 RepID=UPI003B3BBEC3